jgi:hypothetical protein
VKRTLFKRYTAARKKAGYKTPTWFQGADEPTT